MPPSRRGRDRPGREGDPVVPLRRGEVVLDASALLAWLVQERGAEVVGEVLPRAVISAVNLSEVLYRGQSLGRNVATLPARLGHLGLRVEPFTTEDALIATDIFARDRRRVLSLADRCCLATATRLGLPAITDDRAWSALDLGVRIVTFR
jgi:PIN domain nuclease of toxin-antitoxin system